MSSITTPRVGPGRPSEHQSRVRRLLLVGPPGAGKSSQGMRLAERLGVSRISTGDLLREEVRRESPAGRQAAEYISAGRLVPDWLVFFAVELYLSDALEVGFVLDGYPRTLEQAERFMRLLGRTPLDHVIELATPDEITIGRLTARAICDGCGWVDRDASSAQCTRCDGAMQRRTDDNEQVVRSRLETYRRQTEPMLDFFRDAGLLATIDGNRPQDVVTSDLFGLVCGTAVPDAAPSPSSWPVV